MSYIGTLFNATKSSPPLDPIPLSLLHEITEFLSIPLNNIFCESLESGTFPTSSEHALITPLLPVHLTMYSFYIIDSIEIIDW